MSSSPTPRRWVMRGERDVVLENDPRDFTGPGPNEIIVRVEMTAISAGTECANYQALEPAVREAGSWCCYPWLPGYAGVGRVIARGPEVTRFKIGDRVVGIMQHGSFARMEADGYVAPADEDMPAADLSYVRLLNICATAVEVLPGESRGIAGIWGQGTIGNLTAQVLQSAGYRTITIDPIAQRRELAARCGLPEQLDPLAGDFGAEVQRLTEGRGFDVAVDAIGHAPTTIGLPSFVRPGGRIVLMTHWRNQPVADATDFIRGIFIRSLSVHGALETGRKDENPAAFLDLQWRKMNRIQREMKDGRIQVAPLISHVVRPEQGREAYEGLCFDRARWTGVVVDWSG